MILRVLTRAAASALAMLIFVETADAGRNAVAAQLPVTDDFGSGDVTWTGAMAGKFIFAWRPARVDGRLMICGANAVTNAILRPPSENMLIHGEVQADGQPVLRNLRFFNKINVRQKEAMIGRAANCAALPHGVSPSARFSLKLGNGDFRN